VDGLAYGGRAPLIWKALNICLVSQSYPALPKFGGIAVYSQDIARGLTARGHCVHVIATTLTSDDGEIEDAGVHVHVRRVHWLPLVGNWLPGLGESVKVARTLRQLHRRRRFDVVEIPNWEGLGLASTFLPGIPISMRLYTSLTESVEMAGRKPTRQERFMIWAEKTSARRVLAAVTHSEAHRQCMAAAYGLEKIEVIPLAVRIPERVEAPSGSVVLSIGRKDPRKGMDTLFATIPTVLRQRPEARFKIVGVPPEYEGARALLERCPAGVEVLGWVEPERLNELYNQCAIYVSPATYESFGLTFVEAMARGRPVVGCATSAIPETVRDGVDGLLVAPRDAEALAGALVTLLSDEGLRGRMGAAGRQRAVENYSIEIEAARIESYYMRLIEKNR